MHRRNAEQPGRTVESGVSCGDGGTSDGSNPARTSSPIIKTLLVTPIAALHYPANRAACA